MSGFSSMKDEEFGKTTNRQPCGWRAQAALGDAEAMQSLGRCYRYGKGVNKDSKKGFTLQLQAANRGVIEAQFSVGVCFSRGEGVAADDNMALKWYLKAAKRGHDDAACNVALFYERGRGVRMNPKRAEFWKLRAEGLKRDSLPQYWQDEKV